MNTITRTTRTCMLETLDEDLKAVMRAHVTKYGLGDIESNILNQMDKSFDRCFKKRGARRQSNFA